MSRHRTIACLAAGTALAVIWSSAATAQVAPGKEVPPAVEAPPGTPAPKDQGAPTIADTLAPGDSATPGNDGRVQDIIVTAQRRGQNLQKVPIAVTAATAETLDNLGVRSTNSLGTIAPSVTFAVGSGGAAVSIRGVGGTGSGTDEAANALYIDGVYIPSPQAAVFSFSNIERIEVLKGPQGTLFGRNASGGLIQIITPDPGHKPSANFEVGYSNYATVRAVGTVSGGLTDTLSVSLSGVYENQNDGWGRNYTTGKDAYLGGSYGGRAKLVWQPDPDTKLTATALYSYNRSPSTQGAQILPGERLLGGGTALGFYDQTQNGPAYNISRDANYALTVSHNLQWATVTSITSRDRALSQLYVDADIGPINQSLAYIHGPKNSWTQEFQLASPSRSPIQWLVGLFYFNNELFQSPFRVSGLALAPLTYRDTNPKQTTNSYAAYGQATAPVTSTTNVTVGLRYTIDKRRLDVSQSTSNPAVAPVVFPTARTEDKKLTWRFAVDQKLADGILAYASYSRGFKSGLYNVTNPGTAPVRPQTLDAFEVGLKSDLFDRHVRLNVAAFHYNFTDIQLKAVLPSNPTPIFYNAAKAHVNGVDADVNFVISRFFSIQASGAFLSGHYGTFTNAVYYAVNTAPRIGLRLLPPGDATGNATVFTPRWVTNLGAQYKLPTSIGEFTLAGTWNYNDGYFFDPQNRVRNPSYHLVNGTLTWAPQERLYFRVYVNNLLKQKYYTTVTPSNLGDYYFPSAPRTYGVSFGFRY